MRSGGPQNGVGREIGRQGKHGGRAGDRAIPTGIAGIVRGGPTEPYRVRQRKRPEGHGGEGGGVEHDVGRLARVGHDGASGRSVDLEHPAPEAKHHAAGRRPPAPRERADRVQQAQHRSCREVSHDVLEIVVARTRAIGVNERPIERIVLGDIDASVPCGPSTTSHARRSLARRLSQRRSPRASRPVPRRAAASQHAVMAGRSRAEAGRAASSQRQGIEAGCRRSRR